MNCIMYGFVSFSSILYFFQDTRKVLGISLETSKIDQLCVHKSAFKRMRNLRFLKIGTNIFGEENRLDLPESFNYLPPTLKLLCWSEFPMRCMPSNFRPENLVTLKMPNSKLHKLWDGVVVSFENNFLCYY